MKKLIHCILVILLLSACQNREEKTPDNQPSEQNSDSGEKKVLTIPYNAEYNEQTQELELKHNLEATKLSMPEMIQALNLKYPRIKLALANTAHDTVHVRIDDASYLTENMGSAGAKTYMAETTFALTEIAGIKVVNFIFQEGGHAAPGTYARNDFKGFN